MPIYMYRCKECDHEFEVRQRMTDEPLSACPVCQGEIRRVVNTVGVVFKGKGFYVTDNRSGQNASLTAGSKADKAEKSAAADSSSGGENRESSESKSGESSSAKETKPEKAPATAV
ncbi:MAG: FmdB family transcriptional regulator [Chloroflexi bacterium]|nr:FmdB family transcriptional regulator [Chloroflexota bacterium]